MREVQATRRALLGGAMAGAALCAGTASAQGGRVTSLVMPYAPSGGQELLGRILIEGFAERFGGSFVMDHRPGAGTTLAARHVARARPDAQTLLVGTNVTFAQAQFAYRNPGYDPDRDFAHISLLAEALYFLCVNPKWQSVQEVVEEARRRPGQLAYTSWGVGSVAHLTGVDFCRREGIDMIHVPFNGTAAAVTEVIAGRADFIFCILSSCLPHVEAGRLRAVATPSPERIPGFPEIRTMVEHGYSDFVQLPWFSLSGPAGLPEETALALEEVTRAAFAKESAKQRLAALGLVPAARGAADMRARIASDRVTNQRLMHQAGIEPQ
ncbi:Bug family tripartite tricarboxylate transporter substrate binding protein [Sabulicella glaciei]|uniref:Tripartite tricarboxylate transporter substrate binding protein n=1 Tax=Sabulicella glaciei TaxID=2984948 RepID=A0ABT3NTU9_9PROT|nr:tripartite tricarboxylate transporter substrate binding protein [Roseococcus sp. MDT2-1-1]MCW8085588.1 tripartite tricarboxylate transporter substrate binding protein [Roseococcus sp. MDT2-1-1]